jgi:hypothetical protein
MDVIADVDLDLEDPAALKREAGRVLLADRARVVADRETFAAQRKVPGLGLERRLGDDVVVDAELGGAVRLMALAEALLAELDAEDVAAGWQLHVGDELLLGRDADEVVGIPELAVLDEQRVPPKRAPWA